MRKKIITGHLGQGKSLKFIVDLAKIISKTYKVPFNDVVKALLEL